MTIAPAIDMADVCSRMSYLPGWTFDWYSNPALQRFVLIRYPQPSSKDPTKMLRLSHRVNVTGMSVNGIYAHVFAACEYLALHEVKEFFRVDGKRWGRPHG